MRYLLQGSAQSAGQVPPLPKMEQGTPGAAGNGPAKAADPAAKPLTKAQLREQTRANVNAAVNNALGNSQNAPVLTGSRGNPLDMSHMIPPQVVDISNAFFTTIVLVIIGWPLARAFARRLDKKTELMQMKPSNVEPQLRQLQDSVDAMAIELERISESQRFSARLLAEAKKE